jgi:SprB repeat
MYKYYISLLIVMFALNVQAQQGAIIAPPIKADTININNCYNGNVNLVVPNGSANLAAFQGSKIIWEYRLTPPTGNINDLYIQFGSTTVATLTFTPLVAFGNTQITSIQNRYLRVRLVNNQVTTTYAVSVTTPIAFSPSTPKFKAGEFCLTTASCSTSPTGSIDISHSRYTDTILYIVKPASAGTYCNPLTNNPPCFNVLKSGTTTDSNFVITGIPAGAYTVFISNIGGQNGTCNELHNAIVETLPPILINTDLFQHPLCYGDNNGSITLGVSGGTESTYKFNIFPNVGVKQYSNGQATFTNLTKGAYTVTFTDTCGTILTKSFLLTEPPKVIGQVLKTIPNCASPGNGVIKILAKYNFSSPSFNKYNYKLYKNGICIDSLMNTADTTFTVNGLTGANYKAVAYSPNTPNCVGIEEVFILPFNLLTISVDSIKNVNCNGFSDGYIKLKSTGGTLAYNYFLRNMNTGILIQDSIGVFNNLAVGQYKAITKNKTTTCNDSATIIVNINQPAVININLVKEDIQCFGLDNGSLISFVTGGNGGYDFYWEKQNPNNLNWSSYFQTNDTIINLSAGAYRSKISDSKNCIALSNPIVIIEPNLLKIDSVKVTDIPCLAGSGYIKVFSSGGNAVHTQQYRMLPNSTFVNFTPSTPLGAGKYMVRVIDNKGCMQEYVDTLTITSPPSNLDFTYSQSQINGFNISCYGADNGTITIAAYGGNGDGYSGYKYTYDNLPWQNNNTISNIPAGNRMIKVGDARGCIVVKNVLFTQPNDSLTTQLLSKIDIKCFGASTGAISIRANGGVKPYRFSINGGTSYQSDSTFTSLPAGNYFILIKDNNNCTGLISVNLVNLYPIINNTPTIVQASCFGNNDAAIATTTLGGVAPYAYLWTPNNATTNNIASLVAGNYTLKVTDAIGCIVNFNYSITQPAALLPIVNAYPVCFGSTTGKIVIKPVGGTPPYLYSKDNGTSFQTDSIFNNLPQAIYNLKVKDAKNCTWIGNSTVGVISNSPNLNFIISSNQHAQDTITMKEISWIKPDSIKWEFHPAATIIDPSKVEPKIKFANYDSTNGYWVRLIGYYPTCTYITQKIVKIYPYDPNAVVTTANFNKGIKKAELFPNPNNGQFTLNVEFYKTQKATVYITSVPGVIIGTKQIFPASMQILKNFTFEMNGTGPGTYILRIVSDYDSKYILFVKQ